MDVFDKLKKGEPVDMFSEEYLPAIEELNRANKALFHVNHTEPGSKENEDAIDANLMYSFIILSTSPIK